MKIIMEDVTKSYKDKVNPCPFCGGMPKIYITHPSCYFEIDEYQVECPKCSATTPRMDPWKTFNYWNITLTEKASKNATDEHDENVEYDFNLKECPICEGKAKTIMFVKNERRKFFVQCRNCLLKTKDFDDKKDAVIYWNSRKEH